MSSATRFMTAAVVLVAMATSCPAQDQPAKQWVWLSKQGVWGYGYQIQDGPQRGLWRVDPDSKRTPEELVPTTDLYGFAAILNQHRALAGLAPVAYDHELSEWAAAQQRSTGKPGPRPPHQRELLSELCLEHDRRRQHRRRLDEFTRTPRQYAFLVDHSFRNRLRTGTVLDHERAIMRRDRGL